MPAQALCCVSHADQQACLLLQPGQPAHHPGAAWHARQARHPRVKSMTAVATSVLRHAALPHLQKMAHWLISHHRHCCFYVKHRLVLSGNMTQHCLRKTGGLRRKVTAKSLQYSRVRQTSLTMLQIYKALQALHSKHSAAQRSTAQHSAAQRSTA